MSYCLDALLLCGNIKISNADHINSHYQFDRFLSIQRTLNYHHGYSFILNIQKCLCYCFYWHRESLAHVPCSQQPRHKNVGFNAWLLLWAPTIWFISLFFWLWWPRIMQQSNWTFPRQSQKPYRNEYLTVESVQCHYSVCHVSPNVAVIEKCIPNYLDKRFPLPLTPPLSLHDSL